jgi:site-specific recombinase XerD
MVTSSDRPESEPTGTDHLPAVLPASASTLEVAALHAMIPTLIADAGDQAAWRYIDFFTSNIRNPNTRRAYARACGSFLAWADERGRTLETIRPYDVSTYIESRAQTHSAPDVKQQLAAIRMLFDWLITGQILPHNPAAAVRGPKHVVKTGKTPVLDGKEWRKLLDAIPT